jgi:uncharacterized SAM-binding protein YcdF (DUF218 family)
MFFALSKLLSAITQPLFWLGLGWAVALLLLKRHRRSALTLLWGLGRAGAAGVSGGTGCAAAFAGEPLPVPPEASIGQHAGVIVLGGAFDHPASFVTHGQVPLNDSAERMTLPLTWLRQHPGMDLVFSGGEGRLVGITGVSEAELARRFYAEQGLDMAHVLLESRSRSTRENAQRVAELLGPRCREQRWLLVTSAWHMPRSVAEFQAVGCRVTPYPVDFRTGADTPWTEYALTESLHRWQLALHEWIGLAAYRLMR